MGKTLSPQKVLHYTAIAVVLIIGYKVFFKERKQSSTPPGMDSVRDMASQNQHGARIIKDDSLPLPPESDQNSDLDSALKRNVQADDLSDSQSVDVGHIPKMEDTDRGDLMKKQQQFKKSVGSNFFPDQKGDNSKRKEKKKDEFFVDGINWELEEEMKKRRVAFQQRVEEMYEEMDDTQFKDMHESDDDFAFVTAASHTTYLATVEFVYSVQYFFPKSNIGIFDIGLTTDERDFLRSLCQTHVESMWLQFWPDTMYKIRHRVWRPLLLQFGLAKYGHFIYLEPGRFVNKQNLKPFIAHSRKHGVTVAGREQKYSSFVVTSPHMYSFLKVDERKLQRTHHFEFSFLILHNTKRVKNFFMRYLLSCAMEEYCIAPPDSKTKCDPFVNNKKHARCHKYDESAINLILNHWHGYNTNEFLVKDGITKQFDGKDLTNKVKVCNGKEKDEI